MFEETARDVYEAKDRALRRHVLAQIGHCSIADSRKSLGQLEAEELIKIRAARIEKEAEAAASEAYAEAAARGAGKARPPVFEAPAPAPEPQAVPVVAVSASGEPVGPSPLTTGDIAFCFAGLRWDEKGWKKPLGDKRKWLEACIVIPGQRGVSETRWNPVCIGAALERQGHVTANSMRARFQTRPHLIPWLDAWKTYEADYLDNN